MSLPPYTIWFRGRPACPCLAAWLPVYEAELQRRGTLRGPLPIYQLIGGAEASAGTHKDGGAADITDLVTDTDVWVARQMGAAAWARGAPFVPHIHLVLNGCPHNGPARYQIAALAAGFNGLGKGGRGGPDYGPGPRHLRTWREGIEWAREQEDEMKDEDFNRIRDIVRAELRNAGDTIRIDVGKRAKWSLSTALRTLVNRKAREDQ